MPFFHRAERRQCPGEDISLEAIRKRLAGRSILQGERERERFGAEILLGIVSFWGFAWVFLKPDFVLGFFRLLPNHVGNTLCSEISDTNNIATKLGLLGILFGIFSFWRFRWFLFPLNHRTLAVERFQTKVPQRSNFSGKKKSSWSFPSPETNGKSTLKMEEVGLLWLFPFWAVASAYFQWRTGC